MSLRAKKHFQDYELRMQMKNGKQVCNYVYVGSWYVRDISQEERDKERWLYLILSCIAGVGVLCSVSRPISTNSSGLFGAVSLISWIPAFCVLEGSIEAFFRKGKLTEESYKERRLMLRIMPLIEFVLGMFLLFGYLLSAITAQEKWSDALFPVGCIMVACIAYLVIAVREHRVRYILQENEDAKQHREEQMT